MRPTIAVCTSPCCMAHRPFDFCGLQDLGDGETVSLHTCRVCLSTKAFETGETIADYIRDSYQSLPAAAFYTDEAP